MVVWSADKKRSQKWILRERGMFYNASPLLCSEEIAAFQERLSVWLPCFCSTLLPSCYGKKFAKHIDLFFRRCVFSWRLRHATKAKETTYCLCHAEVTTLQWSRSVLVLGFFAMAVLIGWKNEERAAPQTALFLLLTDSGYYKLVVFSTSLHTRSSSFQRASPNSFWHVPTPNEDQTTTTTAAQKQQQHR